MPDDGVTMSQSPTGTLIDEHGRRYKLDRNGRKFILDRKLNTARGGTAYITDRELAERWGLSDVTIWRQRRRGELPPSERISPGRKATRLSVIEAIEAKRAAEANRD
jgi:predicted DNA-binding transcriptional regulator AlpA